MRFLTVIGLILVVVGLLGLFTVINMTVPVSVAVVVVGLICVVFGERVLR